MIKQKNIPECCYSCKEPPYISYKFKKIKDKSTSGIPNKSSGNKDYCHRMCPECLIRHIFINDIKIFEKPANEYSFICPCKEGNISLTYEQLLDLFQNKTLSNMRKKNENLCQNHHKNFTKYCKDCKEDICEECINGINEKHYNHRIDDKIILLEKLKKFFECLKLKNNSFDKFMENFNNICGKFREVLEKNYNDTLISIDKIINSLIDFRAKYSVYYKEKVINSVQTLKILKMFYSNYYYDIHKAENGKDFKIYRYLNQINSELDDVIFSDDKTSLEKLEQIKNCSDYINENINNILDINFKFRKVVNGFRKYQSIQRCDEKNVKYILKIDEHQIITNGEGRYLNYLEENNNGEFSEVSKIPTKDKITSILIFKDGTILTAYGKDTHYTIQEWTINENFLKVKPENSDDSIISKKINNESGITDDSILCRSTTFEPSSINNIKSQVIQSNQNYKYESDYSFPSKHKGDINAMIDMSDNMFATGSNDKTIYIWKKEEKKYYVIRSITKESGTKNLKNPVKHIIYLYDKRLVSCDNSSIYIWFIDPNKIKNPNGDYSLQQKININKNNEEINNIIQVREGYLLYGTNNSFINVLSEANGNYKQIQSIGLKMNSITCLKQLKDNRVIVASDSGLIKILDLNNEEYQINEYLNIIRGLPINCIECFEDGSFILGQKATVHVWKNNESI